MTKASVWKEVKAPNALEGTSLDHILKMHPFDFFTKLMKSFGFREFEDLYFERTTTYDPDRTIGYFISVNPVNIKEWKNNLVDDKYPEKSFAYILHLSRSILVWRNGEISDDRLHSKANVLFNYSPNAVQIERLNYEGKSEKLQEAFEDLVHIKDNYYPYMHRLFEIGKGVPKKLRHDPLQYARPSEEIIFANSTLDILFSGEEHNYLERQLERANLRVGTKWSSIPRLNLGPTKLPNTQSTDVTRDYEASRGAAHLIMHLSKLGIMTTEEAENLVVQKLTHYVTHKTRFQYSDAHAREVLQSLRRTIEVA